MLKLAQVASNQPFQINYEINRFMQHDRFKLRRNRVIKAALFFLILVFGPSFAEVTVLADRVRTLDGSIEGDITSTSREAINLETDAGSKRIELSEVIGVLFEEEPAGISQARINLANGGYRTVRERIEEAKIPQTANVSLLDDIAFMKAEATARLAINGQADPRDAGRLIVAHQKKYPQSFHYYQTVETLGDLLKSMNRFDRAIKQYELLGKSPWPSYQSRAALLSGLVLQKQGNHDAAIARFNQANNGITVENLLSKITEATEGNLDGRQAIDALLAKAKSMNQIGQQEESLKLIRNLIVSASDKPDNSGNNARRYALAAGYNALGNFYLLERKTPQALLAFLRVDYLYDQSKEVHAESLYHLVILWSRYGKPDAANLARGKLRRLYPETAWAAEAETAKRE